MVTPRLLCAVCLAGLIACGDRPDAAAVSVGRPFPALRLPALDGAGTPGGPVAGGRNVLLNVWATWCEPCRREMASLERLAQDSRGVEVVGVSVDEDLNLAREFVIAQRVGFANYSDRGGRAASETLGVQSLPQTFLIGRDGTLLARVAGPRDWAGDEARSMLREALARYGGSAR